MPGVPKEFEAIMEGMLEIHAEEESIKRFRQEIEEAKKLRPKDKTLQEIDATLLGSSERDWWEKYKLMLKKSLEISEIFYSGGEQQEKMQFIKSLLQEIREPEIKNLEIGFKMWAANRIQSYTKLEIIEMAVKQQKIGENMLDRFINLIKEEMKSIGMTIE